jgi:16S rRNA (guanine527-N7)-methyltransferase
MSSLSEQLAEGLKQQGLDIDPAAQLQLIQFIKLLDKWNKVYNLTSIRNKSQMIILHLLDSLVTLPYFPVWDKANRNPLRVMDVGTGGGIPGIPLAICLPEVEFVLVDARIKKIHFIQMVISKLALTNITAIHTRVEQYQDPQGFDRIISRAFASLHDMLTLSQHLCRADGKFLALKGQILKEEIAQLPEGFTIEKINTLKVFGLDAQRHLIQIIPA